MKIPKTTIVLLISGVLMGSIVNAKSPQTDLSGSEAVVTLESNTINVSVPDSARFLEMTLQISTEAGEVIFEERSQRDVLVFDVDASMPDGVYWYTVKTTVVLSEAEQAATPSNPEFIVSTQQSRFYVLDGYKVSENDYIEQMVRNSQARNEKASSSFLLSLAGTVADFFVTSAHATDFTVSDGTPQIYLDGTGVDDTSTPDSDWEIFGNAGGSVGFFRLRNNLGDGQSSNIFGIDGSTSGNGGMTLLIKEDGDVEFGNGRAAFTSSTIEPELVIGGLVPTFSNTVNLELQDDIPYLMFHDTDNGANAGLFNSGTAFILEGNDGGYQDIFTFNLLAPQNSLYVSSNGNAGFGTSTPAEQIHAVGNIRTDGYFRGQSIHPGFWIDETGVGNKGANLVLDGGVLQIQRRAQGFGAYEAAPLRVFLAAPMNSFVIDASGYLGLGINPTSPIDSVTGAKLTIGGVWQNASSRELKENIHEVDAAEAIRAFKSLKPVTFNYKVDADDSYIGFIAEDVPEIVASKDRKSLSSMDMVALVTRVVQEQQEVIEAKSSEIEALQKQLAAQAVTVAQQQERMDKLETMIRTVAGFEDTENTVVVTLK